MTEWKKTRKDGKLQFWNGRGVGRGDYSNGQLYVAAYSQKQAVEIINSVMNAWITVWEIKKYYSPCWGDPMKGIEVSGPCLYGRKRHETPVKLF